MTAASISCNNKVIKKQNIIRDHPFMTYTQRAGGSARSGRVWTGEGGGVKAIMTSTVKIFLVVLLHFTR